MKFENRVAIVTGAAVGIGQAVAAQLAQEGAKVIAVDYDAEALTRLSEDFAGQGLEVATVVGDVSDEAQVCAIVRKIENEFGRVDILVNNAGIWRCDQGEFAQSDSAAWKKKIDVNILGTMYFTRAVLNGMLERRYGRVVNIASVAGVYGNRNMVDYSMTKGAIIAFTTALAKEVSEFGVTVNAVSPGNILTRPGVEKSNKVLSFMRRSGSTQECANVVCFLASDDASYVSGQNYLVDGCRASM